MCFFCTQKFVFTVPKWSKNCFGKKVDVQTSHRYKAIKETTREWSPEEWNKFNIARLCWLMPSSSVYVQNWVFTPVRDNIRGTDESNSVEIITSAQSGKIGLNILIYFYYIGTTAYF